MAKLTEKDIYKTLKVGDRIRYADGQETFILKVTKIDFKGKDVHVRFGTGKRAIDTLIFFSDFKKGYVSKAPTRVKKSVLMKVKPKRKPRPKSTPKPRAKRKTSSRTKAKK